MDLKPNGSEIMVTNENKREYIEYVYAHLQFFIILNSMSGGLNLDHLSKQHPGQQGCLRSESPDFE